MNIPHLARAQRIATIAAVIAGMIPSAAAAQAPAVNTASKPARDAGSTAAPFDHVVVISVDGLRSDALIAGPRSDLPNFHRLMECAGTLNARTDTNYTVTLPNHTGMLTGRAVLGKDGHGWVENDDPQPGATLHAKRGAYVQSIFDVAHDHGLATRMFVGKTKFSLYDQSFDAEHGALDVTGEDNGRDKLDTFVYSDKTQGATDGVLAGLQRAQGRSLQFLHYAVTDITAHWSGWDVTRGSKYLKAVAAVDAELGRLFDSITSTEGLRGKTAIVLTADHGGGAPFKSHDQPHMWVDYVIPFLVWTGDDGAKVDLYAANPSTRRDPGLANPSYESPVPPIRNADAANLALDLLGLPPLAASTINARQDLRVRADRSKD